MSGLVHVQGLSQLERALSDFATKVIKSIARDSLRAGAEVMRDEARARAPRGQPSSENAEVYGAFYGALRASIRVSGVRTKGTKVTAIVTAGGHWGGADIYYGHFVEYGTRPHVITARNRKGLSFGGAFFRSVHHPGIAPYGQATIGPHAFMRPALQLAAHAAVLAVGNKMRDLLAAKGANTAGIQIGGGA